MTKSGWSDRPGTARECAWTHPRRNAREDRAPRHENGHAVLAVCDQGAGIAPEDQERVFQRFYRGEGGKASGSGLGLAIAAELALAWAATIGSNPTRDLVSCSNCRPPSRFHGKRRRTAKGRRLGLRNYL